MVVLSDKKRNIEKSFCFQQIFICSSCWSSGGSQLPSSYPNDAMDRPKDNICSVVYSIWGSSSINSWHPRRWDKERNLQIYPNTKMWNNNGHEGSLPCILNLRNNGGSACTLTDNLNLWVKCAQEPLRKRAGQMLVQMRKRKVSITLPDTDFWSLSSLALLSEGACLNRYICYISVMIYLTIVQNGIYLFLCKC